MITLRFLTLDNPLSSLIRAQAGICMPFTPSHVEAITRDGKGYIGERFPDGMQVKPIGYDANEKGLQQKLLTLTVSAKMADAFHDYCESKIGEPYDIESIFSFAAPAINLHEQDHLICSAIMTAALRHCGFFPVPLTVPFHHISPRDLFLILSSHVQVDH